MQDVLIGRGTGSSQLIRTVTNTATLLIGADAKRFSLIISGPKTSAITISFSPGIVANEGIYLPAGSAPLVLDLKAHGDLVRRQLYAITDAGSETIGILFTVFQE